MTFEQIDKKLRTLRDPELGEAPLERVGAWLEGLRRAFPDLRDRLDREVARIESEAGEDFGRVASQHPAASWLLRRRSGKLSSAYLGCSTPEQVLALANGLGVVLEGNPL
jgi:hypothetical protein